MNQSLSTHERYVHILDGKTTKSGRIAAGFASVILCELRKNNVMRCCRCRIILDKEKFNDLNFYKDTYPYCKGCISIASMQTNKKRYIYKKFDMTEEECNLIIKKQNNCCSICKKKESHANHISQRILSLTVDHCHITGKVRGLLCRNCNLMIGNAKDSQKTLRAAIKYLKKHDIGKITD